LITSESEDAKKNINIVVQAYGYRGVQLIFWCLLYW